MNAEHEIVLNRRTIAASRPFCVQYKRCFFEYFLHFMKNYIFVKKIASEKLKVSHDD